MKIDYTNLSFTQLIDKIEANRFFDLPRMVREAFRRLLTRVEALEDSPSGDSRPYKVYTALLTQSGTDAPVATVLENTLGGTLVWTRDTTGQYTGTLNGAFTENKTFITSQFNATLTPPSGGYISGILGERNDNDSIHLITFDIPSTDTGDGILNETPIEIRVYN